jgi:hypothetical protein
LGNSHAVSASRRLRNVVCLHIIGICLYPAAELLS